MIYPIIIILAAALSFVDAGLIRSEEKRIISAAAGPDGAQTLTDPAAEEDEPCPELSPNRKITALTAAAGLISAGAAVMQYAFYGEEGLAAVGELVLLMLVWACAWTDKRFFIIPNRVIVLGLTAKAVLLAVCALLTPDAFRLELISCAVACTALLAVSLLCKAVAAGAIGFGDVKLLAMIGFFLGTQRSWNVMLITMVVSFVYSLALLITGKAGRKTELPFAPIVFVGLILAFYITGI